jgi:hypothetical protein
MSKKFAGLIPDEVIGCSFYQQQETILYVPDSPNYAIIGFPRVVA